MEEPENVNEQTQNSGFVRFAGRVVENQFFDYVIIALILLSGAFLGMQTIPEINDPYGHLLVLGNQIILVIFILEAILKMLALAPRSQRYFRDGWNVFDFTIIVLSLVPATGAFAMIARLGRLLRVLRLISAIQDLRLIVSALVKSIPNVGHIMMLMSIIVYIYAIIGFQLFHEHDPDRWGNIGLSILTLFEIITLEGWVDINARAMELNSFAWIYFVSFVIVGTFVVVNLFIAVVINNLDRAKEESLKELETPVSRDELLRELRATQDSLRRLEARISDYGENETRQK